MSSEPTPQPAPEGSQPALAADITWKIHRGFFQHHANMLPEPYASQDTLRLTLCYFVIAAQDVLDATDKWDRKKLVDWIYAQQVTPDAADPEKNRGRCGWRGGPHLGLAYDPSGGPHASLPQDCSHIAMTYTALAMLLILGDDFSRVNRKAVVEGLKKLQLENGCFTPVADPSESDMRYVYCACCISFMLNDWSGVDKAKATGYIIKSQSYDGAIGQAPFEEAHAGSTYCALASLVMMGTLAQLPRQERLLRWLVERQQLGFNGRPNKIQDTCYSFWVGASLRILGHFDLVIFKNTRSYTLSCQKPVGGFGKWPDTRPDVLHSYFSLCGLSFIGEPGLQPVNPVLGFSQRAVARLKAIHGDQFALI